jgi:prepilin-type N-terminal cleavage/methylation domain-containing protein
MKFHKFWPIRESQKGFTLLELVVALAITGFISVGIAMATAQVVDQGERNSDYNTASQNTLNAIHWISRDAQMSQVLEPDGASGFPLNLGWVEWDNSNHLVTYTEAGDKLRRSYSVDGGAPNVTLVAQYINWVSENTTCEFTEGVLKLTVTTTVGTGLNAVSVTRMHDISPRPGL